jgi:hypothetical protein
MGAWVVCCCLLVAQTSAAEAVPAEQALRALAERNQLSLVACDIPPTAAVALAPTAGLDEAIGQLATAGIDAVVWRGILIARPGDSRTLRQCIWDALDEHSRSLLFRKPDEGQEWEPGWREHVVECARRMLHNDASAEAYVIACDTAHWLAADNLADWLQWDELARSGRILAHIEPPAEGQEAALGWSGSTLLVQAAAPGADVPRYALRATFADGSRNPWRRRVEREHLAIPAEELAARDLADGIGQCRLGIGAPDARLALECSGAAADVLTRVMDEAHAGLTLEQSDQHTAAVVLRAAVPEDAVLALCAGLRRYPLARAGGVTLAAPAVALERILCAVPLPWWARLTASPAENEVVALREREAVWARLAREDRPALETGWVWLTDLSGPSRNALERLCSVGAVKGANRAVWSLPPRDGPVPLWLYEFTGPKVLGYELRSPGWGELIEGQAYADLHSEFAGSGPLEWEVAK